jgi:hypothetical protein
VFFWQNLSAYSGETIITIDPNENQSFLDAYVELTDRQMEILKPRVKRNMTRVMKNGSPLSEVEMREVVNYIAGTAVRRFDITIDGIYLTQNLVAEYNTEAFVIKAYNEEEGFAHEPIVIDRDVFDEAKVNIGRLVRLLFLVTHEVGHGIEYATVHKSASLNGLAFNLWYDACLSVPAFMDGGQKLDERVSDVYACSVMLDEFAFVLEADMEIESNSFQMTFLQQYHSSLDTNAKRLLMMLLPDISARFNTMPLFETPMVADVIAAYANGTIAPNAALAPLFDRGGSYGLPSYGEFIKYMDEAYGIGQINAGLKEDAINGINIADLKQFTLCAPFMLGMKDVPYKDYTLDNYLNDLHAEYTDVARLADLERIWATQWAADMSNKEFGGIIAQYL